MIIFTMKNDTRSIWPTSVDSAIAMTIEIIASTIGIGDDPSARNTSINMISAIPIPKASPLSRSLSASS